MRLAVIPARGGSKRIPRKNIRPFCGKPIIAWSIEAALASGCFGRVIVSTDDAEIAQVAREFGAETPFLRPAVLADDHAGTIAVVRHAIEWQAANGSAASSVCCLYATAPFVRAGDLRDGLALLERGNIAFAFTATKYPYPIQRALRVDAAGRAAMFDPSQFNTRSQDLEEAWHDAGQFYWGEASAWLGADSLFGPSSIALKLSSHRVQDIDTPEDWARAEWLFKAQQAAS